MDRLPHPPFRLGVQHASAAAAAERREMALRTEDLGYSTCSSHLLRRPERPRLWRDHPPPEQAFAITLV